MAQVLKDIRQETGMRFHHAFPLKGSVSIFLAALPVKQALAQLFGPEASFIFHYHREYPDNLWYRGMCGARDCA